MGRYRTLALGLIGICGTLLAKPTSSFAQVDPASEPSVLAVAKALPAVVNINAERIVRRTVRDPIDDFYAQFFGNYRSRPREIRQKQQSLGSGFIVDPAGYIVTNQHVVERAADLKIQVTTNDDKTYNAHYIDRKSTRLNSSHLVISYAVFCLKKTKTQHTRSSETASDTERSLVVRRLGWE